MSLSPERTSTWPIESELPAELAFLANHISSYFTANPPYNNATLRALILAPPPQAPSLLLVQVCQTANPYAFSGTWEVPSGSPKSQDLTLLHTLARIVLEQTGLHLSRVHSMSGSEIGPSTFGSGNSQWMKLQFTVGVSELDSNPDFAPQQGLTQVLSGRSDTDFNSAKGKAKQSSAVPVLLDQGKHQKHAWVTESDLQEFVKSGLFPSEDAKQYQSMLDAFSLYRQDTTTVQSNQLPSPPLDQIHRSSSDSTIASPASASSPSESMKPPAKVEKRPSKRKASKADKQGPSSSHFHRFRIS